MYEIGREESDLNKHAKIDALKLSDEEWTHVENFTDLLRVSLTTNHPHITNCGISMPTNISRLSHMTTHQVFMLLYQHLRNCTRPGTVVIHLGSMPHLQLGCVLVLPRLKSIITRLQYHMHTPLLCVSSPLIW